MRCRRLFFKNSALIFNLYPLPLSRNQILSPRLSAHPGSIVSCICQCINNITNCCLLLYIFISVKWIYGCNSTEPEQWYQHYRHYRKRARFLYRSVLYRRNVQLKTPTASINSIASMSGFFTRAWCRVMVSLLSS